MKAVGRITHVSSTGKKMVLLYLTADNKQEYCLENASVIPDNAPEFGLYEFSPDDQFCKWIDPNKLIA